MVSFNGLIEGMNTVQRIAVAMLGVYSVVIIATIFLGVLAGVALDISILPTAYLSTINDVSTSFNSLITTLFTPVAIIIQLVIVVVLVVIFFTGKFFGGDMTKGTSKKGDIL